MEGTIKEVPAPLSSFMEGTIEEERIRFHLFPRILLPPTTLSFSILLTSWNIERNFFNKSSPKLIDLGSMPFCINVSSIVLLTSSRDIPQDSDLPFAGCTGIV